MLRDPRTRPLADALLSPKALDLNNGQMTERLLTEASLADLLDGSHYHDLFELDGAVLGKPYTADVAAARWRAMRGRTGVLHSGHSVYRIAPGEPVREAHAVAAASVTFAADVTHAEIDAYVGTGEPLQVAGAFTVDSLGGAFIERVEGDPSTVVGMSLSTVRHLCTDLGVTWTQLWNRTDAS